jgi:hypothetical protein
MSEQDVKPNTCFCATAEEAWEKLQAYRASLELPENMILKVQTHFNYVE